MTLKILNDINREAAKWSALSSGKIDKHEHFTGEEILLFNQKQTIEQVKFVYTPLGKAFEKQTNTIEKQGENQIKAIRKNIFRHRSNTKCFFVFKRFSKWRSYISI